MYYVSIIKWFKVFDSCICTPYAECTPYPFLRRLKERACVRHRMKPRHLLGLAATVRASRYLRNLPPHRCQPWLRKRGVLIIFQSPGGGFIRPNLTIMLDPSSLSCVLLILRVCVCLIYATSVYPRAEKRREREKTLEREVFNI